MAWERRGGRLYYYTSAREGRRVRKEYVGTGEFATAIARSDAVIRQLELMERGEERANRAKLEAAEVSLRQLCELTDLLARAALVVAGYHQHDRGQWRKRRG